MGLAKWVSPKLTAGVELKGGKGKAYILPGAYMTISPGRRLNVGAAFGLTGESDDFQTKTILELEYY